MSESGKPIPSKLAEVKRSLRKNGISAVIDDYIQQRLQARQGQEVPDIEADPFKWIEAKNKELEVPLPQEFLDFYRVFCNGIPYKSWQALDEQARADIMTNANLICQTYGAFNEEGAYYAGSTVSAAYTVTEGVLFVKAAVAKTMGIEQADKVSLQDVWSHPNYAEWMQDNFVNRVAFGQFTTPADEIKIPEPGKKVR